MSKIYPSKFIIGSCIFSFIVLTIITLVLLPLAITSILEKNYTNLWAIIMAFCLFVVPFTVLGFIGLNLDGCKIYYDDTTKTIYREGFICGYKRELKVSDIKEVTVIEIIKDGTYYVLVDDAHSKFTGFSKEAYLKFSKTDTNKKFLRQFWDKPITKIEKPFHPLQ